jgi:acylphosphatase
VTLARTRVVVSGRVQGVWFRESTRRMATETGVSGWVKNLPDGNVEALFEGPIEKVASAVEWCRKGPERAFVASLHEYAEQPEGLTGFQIRY